MGVLNYRPKCCSVFQVDQFSIVNLPFQWDIVCLPSLPRVASCCSSSLFLFVGIAVIVRRCFVLCTSSWDHDSDHHYLNLLTIFFLFVFYWLELEVEKGHSAGKQELGHWVLTLACCRTQPTSRTLFSNFMVGKKIDSNTYNFLCSKQWLQCPPPLQQPRLQSVEKDWNWFKKLEQWQIKKY